MSVAQRYGIRGLVDSRHRLATNTSVGPARRRAIAEKRGKVVVHYAGGAQNLNRTDMQLWQSYAQWHVDRNWGSGNQWVRGNGIMYHVGIGRDGAKHLLYDIEVDRWHCGSWPENGTHLSINLPIGGHQHATPAQLRALREVVDDWVGNRNRANVIGHQEVDWTACPGTLMQDFVFPYRNREDEKVADYVHFPQTGFGVGHGFLDHWRDNGGLMIFGYPLTNELNEEIVIDGKKKTVTVQYFERAVFEYHSDHKPPHRVLLRRLGAEALQRKNAA